MEDGVWVNNPFVSVDYLKHNRHRPEGDLMGSRILTHNLGHPPMGALRELKKSLEAYWKGRELEVDLHRTASDLRRIHWLQQKEAGIDLIPSSDLSLYDHVLAY